ncbi:RNA polymerase I-specific transcription initiation factor RRN3 [Quillaja saponaria]|uniref:RNA polymerase I-specific transcription initiation factor RRN3 n=1 Tax=Quillaja saponaria TaxID=32244 RepID=A0AAD7Q1W6_QUISA|nr:RNA polymerase I-specific transcription initiation factor RRN3 [Quillaja saponaria]
METSLLHSFPSQKGDSENYDELVGYLHYEGPKSPDEVTLLVTTLKALSEATSYIEFIHHEALCTAVFSMSL